MRALRTSCLCKDPEVCDSWKATTGCPQQPNRELWEVECKDSPDELVAIEADKLALPVKSCSNVLSLVGCDHEISTELCPATCGACGENDRRLNQLHNRQMMNTCE